MKIYVRYLINKTLKCFAISKEGKVNQSLYYTFQKMLHLDRFFRYITTTLLTYFKDKLSFNTLIFSPEF